MARRAYPTECTGSYTLLPLSAMFRAALTVLSSQDARGVRAGPPHTHSDDYWSVVLTGVMVNGRPGSKDIPLPAGSYYFQKGGEVHVTKCLTATECVFFVNQIGKFDFMKAE